jgi:acetoin utilization deacetylase AcuC-like enzyme
MSSLLVASHARYAEHDTGPGHPERPGRLDAVFAGIDAAELRDAIVLFEPRRATAEEVARVHLPAAVDQLRGFVEGGGQYVDGDTVVCDASFDAALLAAGAGLEAVERLDRGEADAAFCAVRPPGHHATPARAMGFCLLNNVAVTAAALAERGERVLVVDIDAHHGNGTQDAFYGDGRVAYVSFHEYPLYPGTGALTEVGEGEGRGTTVNVPLPAGATGDVYRRGVDEVVVPFAERFAPTWLLLSAGFDAHRRDPLTGLALSAVDYADVTDRLIRLVPPGHRILFLEGGYDLEALTESTGASLAAVLDVSYRPDGSTSGGPGDDVVDQVARLHLDGDHPAGEATPPPA